MAALVDPGFCLWGFFYVNKSDKVLPGWATSATASFCLLTTMTSPTEDIPTGSLVHLFQSSVCCVCKTENAQCFVRFAAYISQNVPVSACCHQTGCDELPFGSGFPAMMSVRSQNAGSLRNPFVIPAKSIWYLLHNLHDPLVD